jgi:hypothetical protein
MKSPACNRGFACEASVTAPAAGHHGRLRLGMGDVRQDLEPSGGCAHDLRRRRLFPHGLQQETSGENAHEETHTRTAPHRLVRHAGSAGAGNASRSGAGQSARLHAAGRGADAARIYSARDNPAQPWIQYPGESCAGATAAAAGRHPPTSLGHGAHGADGAWNGHAGSPARRCCATGSRRAALNVHTSLRSLGVQRGNTWAHCALLRPHMDVNRPPSSAR